MEVEDVGVGEGVERVEFGGLVKEGGRGGGGGTVHAGCVGYGDGFLVADFDLDRGYGFGEEFVESGVGFVGEDCPGEEF